MTAVCAAAIMLTIVAVGVRLKGDRLVVAAAAAGGHIADIDVGTGAVLLAVALSTAAAAAVVMAARGGGG